MVQRAHRKSPQYQGVGSWCPKHVPMNARVRHAAVQLQQQRNASSQRESAPQPPQHSFRGTFTSRFDQ